MLSVMNVRLSPPPWANELLSDLTDMQRAPITLPPGGGPPLQFDLPSDAYFEYVYKDEQGKLWRDPGNPQVGQNPWFPEVSFLTGPEYSPSPLARPDPQWGGGETSRLRLVSDALEGELRRVTVYTPRGREGEQLPVVIVQDGVAFYRMAGLHLVAEALLKRGEIRPAHFVFVEPNDRNVEYGFSVPYRDFLTEELLPELEGERRVSGEQIWLGASLGGLLSATVALERPHHVHGLVTFSGAFLGTPGEKDFYRAEHSYILEQLEAGAELPALWYLEVGTLEWLHYVNRQVAKKLEERGANVVFTERNAGHNWTNWRNGIADALRFALAPS